MPAKKIDPSSLPYPGEVYVVTKGLRRPRPEEDVKIGLELHVVRVGYHGAEFSYQGEVVFEHGLPGRRQRLDLWMRRRASLPKDELRGTVGKTGAGPQLRVKRKVPR